MSVDVSPSRCNLLKLASRLQAPGGETRGANSGISGQNPLTVETDLAYKRCPEPYTLCIEAEEGLQRVRHQDASTIPDL